MRSSLEIDDQQATLSLAEQIGMKPGCSPCLDMPVRQAKYSILHWKLAQKYLMQQNSARLTSSPKNPNKKQTCKNGEAQNLILNLNISHYKTQNRMIYSSQSKRRDPSGDQLRIQTARTTWRSRRNIENNSMLLTGRKNKSQIQENKNLLFDIWKQHKNQKNSSTSPTIQKQKGKKKTDEKKRRDKIRIKFNNTVKSFEFI